MGLYFHYYFLFFFFLHTFNMNYFRNKPRINNEQIISRIYDKIPTFSRPRIQLKNKEKTSSSSSSSSFAGNSTITKSITALFKTHEKKEYSVEEIYGNPC